MTFFKLITFSFLLVSYGASANYSSFNDQRSADSDHLKFRSLPVKDVTHEYADEYEYDQYPSLFNANPRAIEQTPVDKAGAVIKVARDLVALGEDLYKLVIKGRPNNTTTYAPISVIPKINNQPVDLMDTENWSIPVKRTYEKVWVNPYGIEVVKFRYSVIWSYNGSYDGKGKYLTSVQVIPDYVRTVFGYDFTATMKLGGIQNNGTRVNPIAAATLLIEYTVATVIVKENNVDTFFVQGNGAYKKY